MTLGQVALGQEDNLHRQSTAYVAPEDPEVVDKLNDWKDQKFGMIIHWGLYAVPGMIESCALCSEDWISMYGYLNSKSGIGA